MATTKTTTKKITKSKPATKKAAAKTKPRTPKKPAAKTANTKLVVKKTPDAKTAPAKPTGSTPKSTPKKLSAIDAALQILAGSKETMNCKELVEAMAAKKLWSSPGGKTPHATLYSAILREIKSKGKDARFKKMERGQFAANK